MRTMKKGATSNEQQAIIDEHIEGEEDEIKSSDDTFSDTDEESDVVDQEMREMRKRAKGFTQNLGRKGRQDDSIFSF
jgi:hypothetical protein